MRTEGRVGGGCAGKMPDSLQDWGGVEVRVGQRGETGERNGLTSRHRGEDGVRRGEQWDMRGDPVGLTLN